MVATVTDRLTGLSTSVAVKAPVQALSTANITLSGLSQGTLLLVSTMPTLIEGARVLLKDQTNPVENGIYSASSGDWERTQDFDGYRDVVNGTLVVVPFAIGIVAFYSVNLADSKYNPDSSAITFTLLANPAITYARTQNEIDAGVVPVNTAYAEFMMQRYGWIADGATDNATALASGVAVANRKGNWLWFPSGQGNFSAFPVLDTMQDIVFQGLGAANSGQIRGTTLAYTGSGAGVVVSALSTQGVQFKNLQVVHTNAGFTGTYFKFGNDGSHGDSTFCSILDCQMGATPGTGASHIDLDKAINFTCERTVFFRGKSSIKGQNQLGGSYSVNNKFYACEWFSQISTPVVWGGQSWSFIDCVFEPLLSGIAGAFDYGNILVAPTLQCLNFIGCWFGDVTVAGGTWINYAGEDLNVTGCLMSLGGVNGVAIQLTAVKGVNVIGNRLSGGGAGTMMDFGVSTACAAVSVFGNTGLGTFSSVWGHLAQAPLNMVYNPNDPLQPPPTGLGQIGVNGYEIDAQGVIHQWGSVTVTTGTPNAFAFNKTFPNAVFNLTAAIVSATGLSNILTFGALGVAGATANVAGTAGVNTIHWRATGN